MLNLKCVFLVLQLLILEVVELNSQQLNWNAEPKNFGQPKNFASTYDPFAKFDMWFNQKLDHFSSTDNTLWKQRYYVRDAYFGGADDSPIFLMLGGESAITYGWMQKAFWVEKAQEQNALLFFLEHRFYGKSKPTDDLSIRNLKYLTVEQALEDVVSFIAGMKRSYNLGPNNKWILFGGSYPGNLVAWFRLKYPQLAYGAVASSAPVLSVYDFKDFFKIVAQSLATYSPDCEHTIKEAFSIIKQISRSYGGQEALTNKFNLCDPLENSDDFKRDFAQLNIELAETISTVVQANEVVYGSNSTIENICNIMADSGHRSPLDRFAALQAVFLYAQNNTCLETGYQSFIDYYSTSPWTTNDARQWYWQTCNQIGNFQSTSSEPHVFGYEFPASFKVKKCKEWFGSKYTPTFLRDGVRRTNKVYLGLDIVNRVDRVVFVQGSIDPFHALGILKSSNPKSPAIYIQGTAHVADMMASNPDMIPALVAARRKITAVINSWLS